MTSSDILHPENNLLWEILMCQKEKKQKKSTVNV